MRAWVMGLALIGAGTLSKRLRHSPPAFNEIRVDGRRFETIARTMSPQPKEVLGEGRASAPAS